MDVVDLWVNLLTAESAAAFLGQDENAHIPDYLGGDGRAGVGIEQLLGVMDELDVTTGVLTPAIGSGVAQSLEIAAAHDGRFLVAGVVHDPSRPGRNVRRIREHARDPRFALVRISPLATQVAIDDPKHYPVYQVCEELQLPVAINVGIPG